LTCRGRGPFPPCAMAGGRSCLGISSSFFLWLLGF
jgi:hypothetical protein